LFELSEVLKVKLTRSDIKTTILTAIFIPEFSLIANAC